MESATRRWRRTARRAASSRTPGSAPSWTTLKTGSFGLSGNGVKGMELDPGKGFDHVVVVLAHQIAGLAGGIHIGAEQRVGLHPDHLAEARAQMLAVAFLRFERGIGHIDRVFRAAV